jgi:hypothetical protein
VIDNNGMKRFNWSLWLGLLLSVFGFLSYPLVFVNWAWTRDFPWANLFIFSLAVVLLFIGVRRAFRPGRRRISKLIGSAVAIFSVLVFAFFIFTTFIASRWLPPSHSAPQVGQKAPEFTLTDTTNQAVSLSGLLAQPIDGRPVKGALLIFYRGYW